MPQLPFDSDNDRQILVQFHRIYNTLTPGSAFIFDIATTRQVAQGNTSKGFTEGEGWVVLVESELQRMDFGGKTIRSYGKYLLRKAHAAFIARKLYK
ncbi:hypothetical protein [uncultured Nostoc sp.]|uniref:hypothetical protein n=1 Tax=uncultured Nostoc sp. TaxID=340711 RepID=UPI0035C9CD7E